MPHRICQKWPIGTRSLSDQISSTHRGQCAYQRRKARPNTQRHAIVQIRLTEPSPPEVVSRSVSLVIAWGRRIAEVSAQIYDSIVNISASQAAKMIATS